MVMEYPKTRKRGHCYRLEEATGRYGHGNLRNQTCRTGKPSEAVVLRKNAVIRGLWPDGGGGAR